MVVVGGVLSFACEGCTYRLYAYHPPSQERVKIIGRSPNLYAVHVDTVDKKAYQVPADGKILLSIPTYRPTCGVYLFNQIKIGGTHDPLGTWAVTVTSGGKTTRKLSIGQVKKLKKGRMVTLLNVPD